MFTSEDILQIIERGSQSEEVLQQIELFKTGFPYLKIVEAASPGKGIIRLAE